MKQRIGEVNRFLDREMSKLSIDSRQPRRPRLLSTDRSTGPAQADSFERPKRKASNLQHVLQKLQELDSKLSDIHRSLQPRAKPRPASAAKRGPRRPAEDCGEEFARLSAQYSRMKLQTREMRRLGDRHAALQERFRRSEQARLKQQETIRALERSIRAAIRTNI